MLHFLNTVFLSALAAAGIPVLIHFIARRKAVRIPFSSIRFLKILQLKKTKSLKLKQILLLAMRLLAVVCLVLSFARPVLKSGAGWIHGNAPSSVAIIMDRSASMGREGLIDKANGRLQSFTSILKHDDRAAFFSTVRTRDREETLSVSGDPALENAIKEPVSVERGDCVESMKRASVLLEATGGSNREIVLISDMQNTGFQSPGDTSIFTGEGYRLFILPVQGETENAAVVRGGLENRIILPGSPVSVYAEIQNFGIRTIDEILVKVFLQDTLVSQKTLSLEAGEKKKVVFQVRPRAAGWNWGIIRIDRDAFPQDNTWTFGFRVPETVIILIAGKTRADIQPLLAALIPDEFSARMFRIRQAVYGENWADRLQDCDVAVFSNYPSFSDSETGVLDAYSRKGGSLFLILGKDVLPMFYSNSWFFDRFGIRFASPEGSGGFLSFGFVNFEHPIFQGVFEKGKEKIQSPRIHRFVPISGKRIQPVISLNNGRPLLAEVRTDGGPLLVFTGGLDETWSNAAVSNMFAPMVYRSVMAMAQKGGDEETDLKVGEPIRFIVENDSLRGEFIAVTPSGENIPLIPEIRAGRMVFTLRQTNQPGIYRFYKDSRLLNARPVNLDSRESDFRTISEGELKRIFPKAEITTIRENEQIRSAVSQTRTGRELWREMLFAAVILLFAEMAIAGERRTN